MGFRVLQTLWIARDGSCGRQERREFCLLASELVLISKNGEKNSTKDHNFFHAFASHFMKKKFTMLRNFATNFL
jgi:hypothetical protein